MDKVSRSMLREILNSFSHMPHIDAEAEKAILAEIKRIKEGKAPKKKEVVVDVVGEEKSSLKG